MLKMFGLSNRKVVVVDVTPPASENGDSLGDNDSCPSSKAEKVNMEPPLLSPKDSPFPISHEFLNSTPPSSPPSLKHRRDRSSISREADRSKQFTNRQRSTSDELGRTKPKRFPHSSISPENGLKALEPLHERNLTNMAFAEQQQWITVQQKTFTKW